MSERLQKEKELFRAGDRVKLTFGVLVCTILAAFILVVAAFTVIPITHYYIPSAAIFHPFKFWGAAHNASDFITHVDYLPQVPAIACMTVILGRRYSIVAILLYLITGFFFIPVFSLGGGIKYIFQYGFGYILGFIPMVLILGKILNNNFKPKRVFWASLLAVFSLHIFGIIYLVLLCAIKHEPFDYVQDLLYMMSYVKIFYDLGFTVICVYLANAIRKILWLSMD
ncbi:biotin transporter BioY [bacterium]|nr:biotin transporter BioY [bacterium]